MPPLLKKISGWGCAKILCNKFGFSIKRQTGSHLILVKEAGGKGLLWCLTTGN